jgi:hypothetical protein
MGMGGQRHAPTALPLGKTPVTHCIRGWVGPRDGWTGAENLAHNGIRSPGGLARSSVAIPIELPGPAYSY